MKNTKTVAQGRRCSGSVEVSPHKNVDGFLFPRAILMPRVCPPKTGLSHSMSIALGFSPCHREKAVPSNKQPGTDADSPPLCRATRRAILTSGGHALTART